MSPQEQFAAVASSKLAGVEADSRNVTILLGIASAQQLDIKAIKEDLPVIKEQLTHVESRLDGIDQQLAAILALLKGGQP